MPANWQPTNHPDLLPADTDWTYDKKRAAQEIIRNLWLGPWGAAKDEKFIRESAVTDVLIVREPDEAPFLKPKFAHLGIKYEVLEVRDNPYEKILAHFAELKAYIGNILHGGGRLLVHGNAGMSRSAAVVIAYVMEVFNLPCDQAHHYVLSRRHCISLNEGFKNQLREYEMLFKAMRVCQTFEAETDGSRQKRNLDASRASDMGLGGEGGAGGDIDMDPDADLPALPEEVFKGPRISLAPSNSGGPGAGASSADGLSYNQMMMHTRSGAGVSSQTARESMCAVGGQAHANLTTQRMNAKMSSTSYTVPFPRNQVRRPQQNVMSNTQQQQQQQQQQAASSSMSGSSSASSSSSSNGAPAPPGMLHAPVPPDSDLSMCVDSTQGGMAPMLHHPGGQQQQMPMQMGQQQQGGLYVPHGQETGLQGAPEGGGGMPGSHWGDQQQPIHMSEMNLNMPPEGMNVGGGMGFGQWGDAAGGNTVSTSSSSSSASQGTGGGTGHHINIGPLHRQQNQMEVQQTGGMGEGGAAGFYGGRFFSPAGDGTINDASLAAQICDSCDKIFEAYGNVTESWDEVRDAIKLGCHRAKANMGGFVEASTLDADCGFLLKTADKLNAVHDGNFDSTEGESAHTILCNEAKETYGSHQAPSTTNTPTPSVFIQVDNYGEDEEDSGAAQAQQRTRVKENFEVGDCVHTRNIGSSKEATAESIATDVPCSEVIAFGHQSADSMIKYIHIRTARGRSLKISEEHVIFLKDTEQNGEVKSVFTTSVKEGDSVIGADGEPDVVESITEVFAEGVFTPMTKNGMLIVDGVFVSSYAGLSSNHWLMHRITLPGHLLYKYMPAGLLSWLFKLLCSSKPYIDALYEPLTDAVLKAKECSSWDCISWGMQILVRPTVPSHLIAGEL
uniref:Uncharacterized protein n=1 Tax=Chromera velia CCMP2878 TaxID=1169474 RepID=A0A0G4IAX9_9ALVE|eukprot:Cvel_2128.t1-p1 / transcript=Cvel_2128.t1 / gene=Cvel_2128 / organism=Chromera_velia_CCMP2878 / gene_product=Serine/threonine/tyrosine-interacting protein B, putative / transcript_product=Serine/threonine/tyrosine-interacting protein B, putative / location=Cvel_scaffold82:75553-87328(+) / protein_length=896 / sequence_SO=supercontig / SO=protein_coding / is_pseudo=false